MRINRIKILLLLLGLPIFALGQNRLFTSLGVSVSNVNWIGVEEAGYKLKPSKILSVGFDIRKNDRIRIENKLRFISRGYRVISGSGNLNIDFNYLGLAPLVKCDIFKSLYMGAGGYISLLLNQDYEFIRAERNSDIGINGGMGFEIKKIEFYLEYNHGLRGLRNKSAVLPSIQFYNYGFNFTMNYHFYLFHRKVHQKNKNIY